MKTLILALLLAAVAPQGDPEINIKAGKVAGNIDPMLYGQLFEHIYFSANNGVWQELIYERSFEPEHYPGIPPRDGYFDGWYMDEEGVLHSPTRYEQPLPITTVDTDDYEITADVNWRSYRLARRSWSGGLMEIRFAFRNQADGEPYYFRAHNPYYEARILNPGQTEAQRQAAEAAQAREAATKQVTEPNFSIATMAESEVSFFGMTRKVKTLSPLVQKIADANQINENQDWHKLRIRCKGKTAQVFWDGKKILTYKNLDATDRNDIVLWVNYTEALYRNLRVTSLNGKQVYFEGTPELVKVPEWRRSGRPSATASIGC
jgi:Domain of Unknown Function (DUF1080).